MPTGPPALAMCPAVMPMFALPGADDAGAVRAEQLHVPGKSRRSLLKNHASSCAGTPSVMHTMNSMPASAASITASFTPGAGMKMHDAVAPVAAIASATVGEHRDAVDVGARLLRAGAGDDLRAVVAVEQAVEAALPPVRPW